MLRKLTKQAVVAAKRDLLHQAARDYAAATRCGRPHELSQHAQAAAAALAQLALAAVDYDQAVAELERYTANRRAS